MGPQAEAERGNLGASYPQPKAWDGIIREREIYLEESLVEARE